MYIIIYMTFQKSMYRNSTWTVVNKLYIVKLTSGSCYLIRPELLKPYKISKWDNYGNWLQQLCHRPWFKLLVARKLFIVGCDLFHVCVFVHTSLGCFWDDWGFNNCSLQNIQPFTEYSASDLHFHTANLSQTKEIIQQKGHSSEWDAFL